MSTAELLQPKSSRILIAYFFKDMINLSKTSIEFVELYLRYIEVFTLLLDGFLFTIFL